MVFESRISAKKKDKLFSWYPSLLLSFVYAYYMLPTPLIYFSPYLCCFSTRILCCLLLLFQHPSQLLIAIVRSARNWWMVFNKPTRILLEKSGGMGLGTDLPHISTGWFILHCKSMEIIQFATQRIQNQIHVLYQLTESDRYYFKTRQPICMKDPNYLQLKHQFIDEIRVI